MNTREQWDRDAEAALAPERLTPGALSSEAYAFKQEVYRRHVAAGQRSGRLRVLDLPPEALAEIAGTGLVMRRDAAAALGQLLEAARADLERDRGATATDAETTQRREHARRVRGLGLDNAYRSASTQFGLWDRYFADYLATTAPDRRRCPGGEFGPAAADRLREFIGVWVAAPGFSNHQHGLAVDFALQVEPGSEDGQEDLGPSRAQAEPWQDSWLWHWLRRRAGEFGFAPYQPEPWHWEYRPDQTRPL